MNAQNYGYVDGGPKEARESGPHERAVNGCFDELAKLEELISQASRLLEPVVIPAPPTTECETKGMHAVPACSDVVNSVDRVRARIQELNERLLNLLKRVHV